MNLDSIRAAVAEARRFIDRAEKAEHDFAVNDFAWNGTKNTAACRRASMDLSRALSELREPRS